MSQICSGASVTNHQKWSEQVRIIPQINNIKNSIQKAYEVSGVVVEPFPSTQIITDARATTKHHVTYNRSYQICLDDAIPESIKKDNDLMMSCPDRICAECGNDHSFRANFEGVITSIDLIPELLSRKVKEVLN